MTMLGNNGRLGNQLFQYAMLKSVAHKLNYELKIPNPHYQTFQGQQCLLKNFKLSCGFLDNEDIGKIKHKFFEKDSCFFHEEVFNVNDYTDFFGIFLNKKYFIEFSDVIRKEFEFIPEVYDYANNYITKLRSSIDKDTEIVSIHMRRGDTTDGTNPTLSNYYGPNGSFSVDSVFGSYFYQAKELFNKKKVVYLVFTGGSRLSNDNNSDVDWCKKNLNLMHDNVFYSENNSSIQDFAIMSMCDHNIICHETTFSWWASFLNNNKNKMVVAPKKWFFSQEHRNVEDFYPNNYIIV